MFAAIADPPDLAFEAAPVYWIGEVRDGEKPLQELDRAIDGLAAMTLDSLGNRELLDGVVELRRLANRIAGEELRLLGEVAQRAAFAEDGAVSTASWYRARTRLDFATASRMVNAATRVDELPTLRQLLEAGEVSLGHVTAVTDAAVPRRAAAIAACEDALVELALQASPRELRAAVRHIGDIVDPDGSDTAPLPEPDGVHDPRREVNIGVGFDGLWHSDMVLDTLVGEEFATLLDAFEQPDPADTLFADRRSAGQRRADAFAELLRRARCGEKLPSVQGDTPHALLIIDQATAIGLDGYATRPPKLRHSGEINPQLARQILRNATVTAVLTMGPWRVVNVGRRMRTLPAWLRSVLEMVHGHCRGPDCTRPAVWADAHHIIDWDDGGDTDLNQSIPPCRAHHTMLTSGGWNATFNPDSGIVTWTSPTGTTIHVPPDTP